MTDVKGTKRGLGRGLSALMADIEVSGTEKKAANSLPIEQIIANPNQPRRQFKPEELQQLADSIKMRGILQPLIVRPHPDDSGIYQIVAGERRWRAAQMAQLHELPVLIRDLSDSEVLEVAIIENIQRADLNAIEEAASYRQLMDRFDHTQEKIAESLNKSRSHIANLLRLLNLPESVQEFVKNGQLSSGHARALVTSKNPEGLARKVIDGGLSVRQTEELVRKLSDQSSAKLGTKPSKSEKDADTRALEADLSSHLRMAVSIKHAGVGGGHLTITYKELDQLDELCQLLGGHR